MNPQLILIVVAFISLLGVSSVLIARRESRREGYVISNRTGNPIQTNGTEKVDWDTIPNRQS